MKNEIVFLFLALTLVPVIFSSPSYPLTLYQENILLQALNDKAAVNLAPHVDMYVDEKGLLELSDILSAPVNSWFKANEQRVPNLGFSGAAGWFRIVLGANQDKHLDVKWLLEIAFPLAEEVSFFMPEENGGYREIKTGMDYPFRSRIVDHPNFIFPIGSLIEEKVFYLRMRSTNGALQVPLVVWEESLFEEYANRSLMVWGAVYGIIFVMCFYNLLIFISVRDIAYLFYILYAMAMAGSVLVLNGLGFQYFWMDLPGWNDRATAFFVGVMTFFAICFCRQFNSTAEHAPRLDQYLRGLGYISLLIVGLSVTVEYNLSLVSTLFVTVFSLSMLLAGIYSVSMGVRSSKYFLLAWVTFIGGMLIYTLCLMDIIPANFVSVHGKEAGAILEMILLSLGLADRIKVEKEERLGMVNMLERSENRYHTMFEKAVEGRFRLDKNLNLIEYNPSFIKMFEGDEQNALSKKLFKEVWAEPEVLREFVSLFESSGMVDSLSCRLQRRGGELFDAEMTVFKDLDHREQVFFYGAISDVSEKKNIQDLELKRRQAEEVSEAKSIFLATMSHELRRPINTIFGFSQLIMEDGVELVELKKFNQRIYTSSIIMKDVVNNILDFSKIEAGVLEVSNRHFDLTLLIDVIIETCVFRASERQIEFAVLKSDGLPREVVGDEYHLRQVLINLVDNAIKFTKEGSVELRICNRPGVMNNEILLRFEIHDTGIGISESFMKTLFDEFTQETNECHSGGTGLGLYVAKEYVHALGGDLQVNSELGKGSCFQFEITVAHSNKKMRGEDGEGDLKTSEVEQLGAGIIKGPRILLAEDDVMAQEMVVHFLRACELTVVHNGEAAVSAACSKEFDLVLMDLRMPKLDGIAATKRIRDIFSSDELPIVAMSGNAFSSDIDECLEAGMNDHIAKPVKKDELIYKIQRLLFGAEVNIHSKSFIYEGSVVDRFADDWSLCFDLTSMHRALGKSDEMLVRQLRHFIAEYSGYVIAMEGLFRSEDFIELSHYFHRLKSSAALLGATELANCCEDIEAVVDREDFNFINELSGLKSKSEVVWSLLDPVIESATSWLQLVIKELDEQECEALVDLGSEGERS